MFLATLGTEPLIACDTVPVLRVRAFCALRQRTRRSAQQVMRHAGSARQEMVAPKSLWHGG